MRTLSLTQCAVCNACGGGVLALGPPPAGVDETNIFSLIRGLGTEKRLCINQYGLRSPKYVQKRKKSGFRASSLLAAAQARSGRPVEHFGGPVEHFI